MFFFIQISSKNKETLKLFLRFLSKFDSSNLNLVLKYFPKQKIKKFITILKSPHVNKSAQEQFEFRVYTKKLFINSTQHLKFLYFLKKLQNTIFPFVNLKVKGSYNSKLTITSILNQLESNRLSVGFFSKNKFKKNTDLMLFAQYFNLLDCKGEYIIKNFINKTLGIFSSVG
jgi:ribosomal protein S10